MARKRKTSPEAPVSKAELEVLKVLWSNGPGTVREIDQVLSRQGSRRAYTTVLTLLQRLQAKGYINSEKTGAAYKFYATVSRERLVRTRLRELADQLTGGTATPLVQALVEESRFSPEEIEHFRRLLDDLESQSRGGDQKGTSHGGSRRETSS